MTDSPLSLPDFPDELASEAAEGARELHAAAVAAGDRLAEVHETIASAREAARLASEALDAEVVRSAQAGPNEQLERKLADKLRIARELADPRRCELRVTAAVSAQREAVGAFLRFCAEHAADLLGEVIGKADASAEEYREALSASEEILRAPLERWAAVEHLARMLTPCVSEVEHPGEKDWTLPTDPATAPVPPVARQIVERAADADAYDARLAAEHEAAHERHRAVQAAAQRHEAEVKEAQQAANDLTRRALRGQLPPAESSLQLHQEHPTQVRLRELKAGSLARCLEDLAQVNRRAANGQISGSELDALRRGDHSVQLAIAEHPANQKEA